MRPSAVATAPEARDFLRQVSRRGLTTHLRPVPRLSVSEWADQYRVIAKGTSPEHGPWRTSRVPYLREIMDAFSDPAVERVFVMAGSQVGKSEVLLNVIGYFIHQDPSPILLVRPTDREAEQFSKTRIAGMIRETPELRSRISDPRSRDSGNTIMVKEFDGGDLSITGSNSAAELSSKPRRVALFDEVDRFKASAGTEGDPFTLGTTRTSNFWNRKIGAVSSPSIEGMSKIEALVLTGDQCRFEVPMPCCGAWTELDFHQGLVWPSDRPQEAQYQCPACGALIPEREKGKMTAGGRWTPIDPAKRHRTYNPKARSFLISTLISSWKRWGDLAQEFLEVKDARESLQVFVNTKLGQLWTHDGKSLKPQGLAKRAEPYGAELPSDRIRVLVGTVDVQDDRLEVAVIGFGPGRESWRILYEKILGDPGHPSGLVWKELDKIRARAFHFADERTLGIRITGVDFGGHHSEAVADYVKVRRGGGRVVALKGAADPDATLLPRKPSINNKYRTPLYTVGVSQAKQIVWTRLKIEPPTEPTRAPVPGLLHFPDWLPVSYYEGLVAERPVPVRVNGRTVVQWKKRGGQTNEPWDLEVMAVIVLELTGMSQALHEEGKRLILAAEAEPEGTSRFTGATANEGREGKREDGVSHDISESPPKSSRIFRRGGGWMTDFRD